MRPAAELLLVLLAACRAGDKESGAPETGSARWTGEVSVRVVDPEGLPVPDAAALLGGVSEDDWAWTDAEGRATVVVTDDGLSDRWITAGKEGWTSGGVDLDEEAGPGGELEITLEPLPAEDNPLYDFQPGGDGMSVDASYCGHCHPTLGDDWASSDHARAASNSRTWDLYTGRASEASDCDALGGEPAEGQEPGVEGGTASYCYVDEGVLGWLNDCAIEEGRGCDHPDRRDAWSRFGSCGDCHSPAIDGAVGGQVDLADATGVGFEGVTCDFCHKVLEVDPDGSPGLDGAITLIRPSDPTTMVGQQYDPITTGPYPDVIVGIMQGSYTPQMRDASWCGGCHQYDQPALHPEQSLDPLRWPDGLPVFETWREFEAAYGEDEGSFGCRSCHMDGVDEESSTYDITTKGLLPSPSQGWLRRAGEVRHHDFPGAEALSAPSVSLALEEVDGELVATVTVANRAAGHAVPTGEPMKQLIVLVSATEDGAAVLPVGGAVVPDVGGALAAGELGVDVEVAGSTVRFAEAALPEDEALVVRFARPTGGFVDYEGPGTAAFSSGALDPSEKGMEELDFLGEVAVSSVSGGALTLAGEPPALAAGDRVTVASAEDHAGTPGWIFAKILVDAEGNRGVPHYRAVDVASDDRLAPGGEFSSEHRFALPAGELVVTATLVRRAHAMTIARPYGWDPEDTVVATTSATW